MGFFGKDRRTTSRKICSDLIEISFRDRNGDWATEVAVVEDLSTQGVRLSLDARLVKGQSVWIEADGFHGAAEVRYCELAEFAYNAGLAFQSGVEWDPAKWQPKHSLELPDLDEPPKPNPEPAPTAT